MAYAKICHGGLRAQNTITISSDSFYKKKKKKGEHGTTSESKPLLQMNFAIKKLFK